MCRFVWSALVIGLASIGIAEPPATAPATKPSDVAVTVQSLRISRNTPELQKRFRRGFNDGEPGVQVQLILETNDPLLPLERDALTIDTFVDDTYQNLLAPNRDRGFYNPYNNQPVLSLDGKAVTFGLQSSQIPAPTAERVFVRGAIRGRIARGESSVDKADLPLKVGTRQTVGAITLVVRSVSESERGALTAQIAVEGDTSMLRRARALGGTGKVLQEMPEQVGGNDDGEPSRLTSLSVTAPAGTEKVTLELTRAAKIERVRIPFETQIDFGGGQGGPIEVVEPAKRTGPAPRTRTWPPPPVDANPMSARRINPTTRRSALPTTTPATTQTADVGKITVDLFSLTVAKPSPSESTATQWATPPGSQFRAAGYTLARLLVSSPQGTTLTIPDDAITVTSFEDDKGGRLDTTLYRIDSRFQRMFSGNVRYYPTLASQSVIAVPLATAPTAGSARCTIKGTVHVKLEAGTKLSVGPAMKLQRGEAATIGPVHVDINSIYLSPMDSPEADPNPRTQLTLSVDGSTESVRLIEIVDAREVVVGRHAVEASKPMSPRSAIGIVVSPDAVEPVAIRVRHVGDVREADVPFEINTGVGL